MKDDLDELFDKDELDDIFDRFNEELKRLADEPWRGLAMPTDTWNDYRVMDERVPCTCGRQAVWGDYLCSSCRSLS
jgi:hypothetical protein